ncbi:hypothetical protein HX062_07615 [Myroides sp. DF42-4-2]|nr:hypothetical protein [Myroides sp. DF42-4-2]
MCGITHPLSQNQCHLRIVRYTSEYRAIWNHFLQRATHGSFLFHRDFMDYHQARFTDHSLLVYEGATLIALLPAHEEEQVLCSHFGLSYGSIIQLPRLSFHQYLALVEAIAMHCQEEGLTTLLINEIPSIYNKLTTNTLAFISHALQGGKPTVQLLSTLDFEFPIQLNTNRKRMVQKGIKKGYTIKEDLMPTAFWRDILQPRLRDRYQTSPVHSVAEISQLMQAFPESIKQVNVYNAEGVLVGGTTLFIHPQVVHLQYIAGKEEDNKNGALDLLIYTLLKEYQTQVRYFDFGSSHLSPKQLNAGLLYWKESFGARSTPQYCYSFQIENLLKVRALID